MREFFANLGPWGFTILWFALTWLCLKRGWTIPAGIFGATAFTFLGTTIVGVWLSNFGRSAPVALIDLATSVF